MPIIFGYGSLICRTSAEKTLGRSLSTNDVCCANIQNHVRSWTAQGDVKLMVNNRVRPSDALFLDLTESQNKHCNGVAIRVSQRELRQLDIRECCYERSIVELDTGDGQLNEGFAYRVPSEDKQHYGITLAAYRQIVENALTTYPEAFTRQFWETTLPSEALVVEGEYIFEDCAQNAAAGQCFSII